MGEIDRVLTMTTIVEFRDETDYQQYKREMLELNSMVDFKKLEKNGNLLIKSAQSETFYSLTKANPQNKEKL